MLDRDAALSLYRQLMRGDDAASADMARTGIVLPPMPLPGTRYAEGALRRRERAVLDFLRQRMHGDEYSAFMQRLEADSLRMRRQVMNRGGGRWVSPSRR